MPVSLAHPIVLVAGVYLAIGLTFALVFVLRWAGRVDPAAQHGTLGFRLLFLGRLDPECTFYGVPKDIARLLAQKLTEEIHFLEE
jgi:hypothetical protein